ncbi:CCR4-NOT transcription complex subunit 10 isoform X1 [Stomoxys calcitrans]|uniref:CCR4-NOT transcription complex subunit 10 isoform X1 n=2 Tax=Stomoxys calcitrans TaxID=35570 RepID=UPI0027E256AE|nr:CCR4-NOT transcription complex subunit 10 isoform X1 [Stomoxys calcitrans]
MESSESAQDTGSREAQDLITKASDEFDIGNYDECINILQQLEKLKGRDCKSHHNQAVAKFYKGKCKDYWGLLKTLEELDVNESSRNIPTISALSPVPLYNKAVIYYHRHMYQTAMDTISPITEKIETYDANAIAMIGILMLRLLLATNQPQKAYRFLETILGHLGINIATLATDECNVQETVPRLEEKTNKHLKLLSLLTHVVNRKIVVVPEDGSPEFAALKAHQYYIMKDFQMAAKQLKKINVDSYMGGIYNHELNTLIANNMGVIHLRVRHYAIAANFFQNAINFDKHIASNLRNAELHDMSSAKSCEILYNLGIAMLHLRRPKEAFQCFLMPLKTYHSNPRLWFRIAEACIMEYEMKRSNDEKLKANSATRSLFSNRIDYSESSQSAAVPEPTMPFAALSLRNALTFTRFYMSQLHTSSSSDESAEGIENQESNWQRTRDNNFCNPSGPVTKESFDTMLSSIYAAHSYVCLRLGDYVTALEMAEELLKMENLSDAHKMLAHMYAGEAFIMMDNLSEARPHLEPTFVSNLNTFDFETKDWQVKSLDAAQNVVRYNLAVAMTLQGDLEMARSLLNTCTHPIVAQKVFNLKKTQGAIMAAALQKQQQTTTPRIT